MSDELWRDQPDPPATDALPADATATEEPPVAVEEPPVAAAPDDGVEPELEELVSDSAAPADLEAPAEPEPDPLEAIHARIGDLAGSVAELAALEQRHTDLIERLHADNTRLRDGELVTALKPLFLDLARLYDDVDDMIERGGEAFARVGIVRDLIADLLERHGVTTLAPEAATPFESGKHTAVGVEATEDPSLNGTIASVRRIGFLRDGIHVVRPAQVYVHRSTPVATPAAGDQTSDDSANGMEEQ